MAQAEPVALPISKFARLFDIGPATVYRKLRNGELAYKLIGSRRYVLIPPTERGPRPIGKRPPLRTAAITQEPAR
jgi:Helix-turn-helix domain